MERKWVEIEFSSVFYLLMVFGARLKNTYRSWFSEAATAHLSRSRSLWPLYRAGKSRVQPCGKPGQGTDLTENYPCLLAQLSAG